MKFGAISKVVAELDKEMEPEFEKLKKKFDEVIDKGDYIQKAVKAEVSDEEDAGQSNESLSKTHHFVQQITSEDPKLDLGFYLDVRVYIKDHLMQEDDEDDSGEEGITIKM